MRETLVVVDITAILFRMYFSKMQRRAPAGVEIGGVWGVCTTLRKIIDRLRPRYFAATFDAGEKTFRNTIYPQYKANRGSPPDDLIPQFDLSYRLCEALGISCFRKKGFEADDLMATLARMGAEQEMYVQLLSIDKDLNQLITEDVVRINFFKNQVFTRQVLYDTLGIYPEQAVDYMSLIGDSVDNIPGVYGIGPKKSSQLLSEWRSLSDIYQNLETIESRRNGERLARLLREGKDRAFMSQRLITLRNDIDLSMQPAEFKDKLRWKGSVHAGAFLRTLGLQKYTEYLKPK